MIVTVSGVRTANNNRETLQWQVMRHKCWLNFRATLQYDDIPQRVTEYCKKRAARYARVRSGRPPRR